MKPKIPLLLHVCCGPCATYPIRMLQPDYLITGFFFNPNIDPPEEYRRRLAAAATVFQQSGIVLETGPFAHAEWRQAVGHLASEPEGGSRCALCFRYRLERAAAECARREIPYFTTTLTIGPNKPARVIYPVARAAAAKHGVQYLAVDFKKKDGFKISCRISREENLYRQDYCGCEYSAR